MAAPTPPSLDVVNQGVNWFVAHFWDEVAAVRHAPVFFTVSVAAVTAILYFAFRSRYADRLASKDAVLQQVTATRDDFKMRWEAVQKDLDAARARIEQLSIPQNDLQSAQQIEELKESVSPKLDIEFEDKQGFVCWTPIQGRGKACFIRVLPKPSTSVGNCKGYLTSFERLENDHWVSVGLESRPQLHWSEVWEQGIKEVDLFTDNNTQFLDVLFVLMKDNSVHLATDQMPFRETSLFVRYPRGIFKVVITVAGNVSDKIVEAKIALRFQQNEQGGQPKVAKL